MSLGNIIYASKYLEDDEVVIYHYSGVLGNTVNWYEKANKIKELYISDGEFIICKECINEPIIRKKTKRLPNGKKKIITKKIFTDIKSDEYINDKKIILIRPCLYETADLGIFRRIVYAILYKYQEEGYLQDIVSFIN